MIFYKEEFRKRRKQARWSFAKLSENCGVDASTLSRWESGVHSPSESNIRMLGNVLDIPVSEISDLPNDNQSAFIGGIQDFNKLANIDDHKLQAEEEFFISRIKQQREQIKKANLVINSLLNTMNSAFYIKDRTNKYILANNAFLELTQKAAFSSVEGKDDFYFFPKNEAEDNIKFDKNILELNEKATNLQMHIPGTRKKRWGLITKLPITNSEGKVEGMLCTIKDITEEKEANELNLELRSTISDIQDVVWTGTVIDYKFKYTTVNDATKSLLGLTQEQFFKDEWKKHVHPDFFNAVEEHLKDTKTNPKQVEFKYKHPITKEIQWIQSRSNADGKYFFGIIRDITMEKYLEDGKIKLFANTINNMDSCVLITNNTAGKTDVPFKMLFVSDGFERIFEVPKANIIQNPYFLRTVVHPDDLEMVIQWWELECDRITTLTSFEYRIILPNGKVKWVHDTVRPAGTINGEEIRFGMITDITDKKNN